MWWRIYMCIILHEMTWAWQAAHYTVVLPPFSHLCFNDQWRLESELLNSVICEIGCLKTKVPSLCTAWNPTVSIQRQKNIAGECRKSLLDLVVCIGVVRKKDFFLTLFYYRRLFLYWIWTHLCILNELSARRCTSLLMVTAILMTASCYSCWSTCLRRHVFPFCMITQKNISIQYPVRGYSVTDAACLMSALLSQDFSVWILHSLLKVAVLSHVLSRAGLRDL